MTHKQLNDLRNKKDLMRDEQYTPYEVIDAELRHYTRYLRNKSIYMPCDGPQSMFVKWFKDHPELNCRVTHTSNDYRNPENIRRMRDQDIVITNPPFSLCITDKDGYNGRKIPFIPLLLKNQRNFLIICTELHVKSASVLPSYQAGRTRFGYTKATKFILPDGTYNNVGTGCWFTTLPVNTPAPRPVPDAKHYPHPVQWYPRDMKTGAIVVPNIRELPTGYTGPMVVQATSLKYFRPDEYNIHPKSVTPLFKNGKQGFACVYVQRKR